MVVHHKKESDILNDITWKGPQNRARWFKTYSTLIMFNYNNCDLTRKKYLQDLFIDVRYAVDLMVQTLTKP